MGDDETRLRRSFTSLPGMDRKDDATDAARRNSAVARGPRSARIVLEESGVSSAGPLSGLRSGRRESGFERRDSAAGRRDSATTPAMTPLTTKREPPTPDTQAVPTPGPRPVAAPAAAPPPLPKGESRGFAFG
eukprot:Hpha_TRINITY_DN36995_c0_g1::TRINITY_DN36995_c0_g1_i1::g.170954::m.170954